MLIAINLTSSTWIVLLLHSEVTAPSFLVYLINFNFEEIFFFIIFFYVENKRYRLDCPVFFACDSRVANIQQLHIYRNLIVLTLSDSLNALSLSFSLGRVVVVDVVVYVNVHATQLSRTQCFCPLNWGIPLKTIDLASATTPFKHTNCVKWNLYYVH